MLKDRFKRLQKQPQLGKDPIVPLLLRFSLPAIFTYFISELYNMVDTYYVGNDVGATAIGALGTVFPVQRVIIALSLLLAFGTTNLMAYYQGVGDKKESERMVSSGIVMNFLIMIPYTIIVFLFRHQLMPVLGAQEALFEPAVDYVTIIIWGGIFLTLTTTMARVILTLGHAMLSVVLTSLGAFINIVGDHILVYSYEMGITGAAIATLTSQVLSCLITLIFYLKITKQHQFGFDLSFSRWRFKKLFGSGLPSFIVKSEDAIVITVMNLLLLNLAGETGINVMSMNTKVYMFLFVLILGFAYGMVTVVAFNYGARKQGRVRDAVKASVFLSLGASIVSTTLFYIFTEPLLSLFVEDANLIELCVPTFRLMILGLPLLSLYYASVMYFQAIGMAVTSTILTLMRQLVILLPLAFIFVLLFNVNLRQLFYAYPLTDLIAAVIGIILLRKHLKKVNHALSKEGVRT